MRRPLISMLAAAAALAGCATISGDRDYPARIAYETGPCFGACPVYRVTVDEEGRGVFEGRRFTAVTGAREFTVSQAQYRAFARQLAPLRPESGYLNYSGEACEQMATDLPSASVVWQSETKAEQSLHFYFGCDMEKNRQIAERLESAPDLLPIQSYIGR